MVQESFPMIVGGDEVLNERDLLTRVENGLMMNGADSVRFIVIHCSATRRDQVDYINDKRLAELEEEEEQRRMRRMNKNSYLKAANALDILRKS